MCVSAYDTCAQHTFYLVSVCMFSHTSAQIYVRKHSAMCAFIHTYNVYTHLSMCAFIHTYNVYTHLSMCAYIHVMCVCVYVPGPCAGKTSSLSAMADYFKGLGWRVYVVRY